MSTRFDSLPPQVKEAIATWEVLRRLGFAPEGVGVGQAPDGQAMVNLQHGEAVFTIMLGPLTIPSTEFLRLWQEACQSIYFEQCDPKDVGALLRQSQIYKTQVTLIDKLMKRGLMTPEGHITREVEPKKGDLVIDLGDLKS